MKKFLIGLCVLGLSMFSIPCLLANAEDVNIDETTVGFIALPYTFLNIVYDC